MPLLKLGATIKSYIAYIELGDGRSSTDGGNLHYANAIIDYVQHLAVFRLGKTDWHSQSTALSGASFMWCRPTYDVVPVDNSLKT